MSIKEALGKGRIAFRGRVVELRELKRSPFVTTAEATIAVAECYYGERCRNVDSLRLQFWSQATRDTSFGVQLPISQELVLVLMSDAEGDGAIVFDSGWEGGIDVGYLLESYPDGYPQPAQIAVSSVYGLGSEIVERDAFVGWARRGSD